MPHARVHSFAPVISANTRILILGSMPGVASLNARQYYAHPQNHFWRIMGEICGAGPALPYGERLQVLLQQRLGLWDVLQSCVRGGSLIRLCCNGGTAFAALQRYLGKSLAREFPQIDVRRLPSTSPANASWSYARKLETWAQALRDRSVDCRI